ncbi:M23 family metallopeptidase [Streptomyces sp. G-G2]|uniref:M23 family metallopeptidase n=1 Tax=Streptomyces sp. G-G2 TaxID=3046201 RepID=UPI0024B94E9B|nr:M23 family metallopeptidase [Streptomyces sp. G-G2]MDJ0384287.1 M23 family metallopeptidase [Streptomyces sp. G-G2]
MPPSDGVDVQEFPTAGAWGEWNPTEDSARPPRGKHRVANRRGGLARSSTVLGVGVIAAVGAGGMATAQGRPQVSISIPSLGSIGGSGEDPDEDTDEDTGDAASGPARDGSANGIIPRQTRGGEAGAPAGAGRAAAGFDAGEVLRHRILQQAESQQDAAATALKAEAERAAHEAAAGEARQQRAAADEAARAKAEETAKAREQAKAQEQAKAEAAARQAKAPAPGAAPSSTAGGYVLPTSAYTLTSHYGDSGSMWSSGMHTGLDFAAPTGTPVKAVHGGTVVSAGWSGAYGYRIVLQLPDGTEIWYCHLSSMSVTSGSVDTGETIGRVGATGNVTGAHLHLEVRTDGATRDPLTWLQSKGLNV